MLAVILFIRLYQPVQYAPCCRRAFAVDPPSGRNAQHGEDMKLTSAARTPTSNRHWLLVVIGLAIAYSPSYVNILLRWAGITLGLQGPPSVILWNWLAVGILLIFILRVEKRGFDSIALTRPSAKDIQWAITFWGIATGASWMVAMLRPLPQSEGLGTILELSLPVLIALILTTSITEEILYRGYPIERLQQITGSVALAVSFSFILFVLPHITFFGPQWILSHGVTVVLLYVLYVWRRNLWACMIMHLLGNALVLIPATGIAG
jgi:uncharacterized protein